MPGENENAESIAEKPEITVVAPLPREMALVPSAEEMSVTHSDGTTETVTIRKIPTSLWGRFFNALGNEAASIELYCDKPKGWADTLTPQSADAVADKGLEINLSFFSRWYQRQAKWTEATNTGAIMELQKKLSAAIGELKQPLTLRLTRE